MSFSLHNGTLGKELLRWWSRGVFYYVVVVATVVFAF